MYLGDHRILADDLTVQMFPHGDICACHTHRWVCNDFPEMKLALENNVLKNYDATK